MHSQSVARTPAGLAPIAPLVHLYAERGSQKFEKAAMRWLERYLVEGTPRLHHFAEITTSLAQHDPDRRSAD